MSTTSSSVSTMSIPLGKDGKKAANIPETKKHTKSFKQFWKEIELSESILNESLEIKRVVTHNDEEIDVVGTHKIGTITISYDKLVKKFGKPIRIDDEDESWRVEWQVRFDLVDTSLEPDPDVIDEMVVITIYDWNQQDTPVEEVTEWNVGGKNFRDLGILLDYLNLD